MRVKFTIAVCALLVLALGASQAYAQGYGVSRGIDTVAQHGKNQEVGEIQLDYDMSGGDIDAGETITITFMGALRSLGPVLRHVQDGGITCDAASEVENDEDTGAGTLTIETTGTDFRIRQLST